MTKKKKTSREKRALIGAVCTAAVILAGSTFAWFTSSDEVTNRLTASGNYGVDVFENFTPPDDDWTPGQEVNKEVQALNTGNIDAYVKLGIESIFTVTLEDTSGIAIANLGSNKAKAIALGNLKYGDANYGKDDSAKNQAKALQAGGAMVVAAGKSLAELTAASDFTLTNGQLKANSKSGDNTTAKPVEEGAWLIDSDDYVPDAGTGVYIFRREIQDTNTTNAGTKTYYAYAGYYYDDTAKTFYALTMEQKKVENTNVTNDLTVKGITETEATYSYKIGDADAVNVTFTKVAPGTATIRSTTTYSNGNPSTAVTANKGGVAYEYVKEVANTEPKNWATESTWANVTHIRVTYDPDYSAPAQGATYTDANGDNNVVVYVKLDSTGKASWLNDTVSSDGAKYGDFLYSKVLHSGELSDKLISSVTLGQEVGNNAFYDLTYDLNVTVDSVQAVKDKDGNYTTESINAQWGSGNPFTFGTTAGNYTITDANKTLGTITVVPGT